MPHGTCDLTSKLYNTMEKHRDVSQGFPCLCVHMWLGGSLQMGCKLSTSLECWNVLTSGGVPLPGFTCYFVVLFVALGWLSVWNITHHRFDARCLPYNWSLGKDGTCLTIDLLGKTVYIITVLIRTGVFLSGVLCDKTALSAVCAEPGSHLWPWPTHELWSDGRPWCLSDHRPWKALWVLVTAASQVVFHCLLVWVAQPGQGELCLHLQQLQGPCGDKIPLLCVWGKSRGCWNSCSGLVVARGPE